MIATQSVELRAGARLLVKDVTVRINHGDRIGFVGRNGAGKSTLAKVLAGETLPAGGQVVRTGSIGYLPQDPRTGDQGELVLNRILSARGLRSDCNSYGKGRRRDGDGRRQRGLKKSSIDTPE
jgi:ATPase subunit of ABC transporter with duplicated ATPase domains